MREGDITRHYHDGIQQVRVMIMGVCAASVHETLLEASVDSNNLVQMMQQNDLRIRGNRSEDTPMTWSDVRLILIADMRLLLTYLERNT